MIVKADDLGLLMSTKARTSVVRALGHGIVHSMPGVLRLLMIIGTAAMLWVGGSIVIHGLEAMGFGWVGHHIHDWSAALGHAAPQQVAGIVEWFAKASMDGLFGLALGLVLMPIGTKVIAPLWEKRFWAEAKHRI